MLRTESCPQITKGLIDEIPLSMIVDRFVLDVGKSAFLTQWALQSESHSIEDRTGVLERAEKAGQSAVGVRRRRPVNEELLRDVSRIYSADTTGAPTKAVSAELFTSHRNATRWVALARTQGLLPAYANSED